MAGRGRGWVYLVAACTEGKEMGDIARETDTPLTTECGDACREHFQVGDSKLGWE